MPRVSFDNQAFVVDYEMGLLHRSLDHIESLLENDYQELDSAVNVRAEKIADEKEREEFRDYVADEFADRSGCRAILLNSFFAASFATFEHRLYRICYRAQADLKSSSSVDGVGEASRLEKARKYLAGLGIRLPDESNLWEEIKVYAEIRNRIMHEGGRIRPNEDLRKYATRRKITSPNDGLREIRITKVYCSQAIEKMRRFLLDSVTKYYQWRGEQSGGQEGKQH